MRGLRRQSFNQCQACVPIPPINQEAIRAIISDRFKRHLSAAIFPSRIFGQVGEPLAKLIPDDVPVAGVLNADFRVLIALVVIQQGLSGPGRLNQPPPCKQKHGPVVIRIRRFLP